MEFKRKGFIPEVLEGQEEQKEEKRGGVEKQKGEGDCYPEIRKLAAFGPGAPESRAADLLLLLEPCCCSSAGTQERAPTDGARTCGVCSCLQSSTVALLLQTDQKQEKSVVSLFLPSSL